MSKAALVRGAFAMQCTLSVPPVISAVSRCSHACSHYQSPIVKYGTVEISDLAKCRQDDLCCRRTIRRWNPEARGFRLMYYTVRVLQMKKNSSTRQFHPNHQYTMYISTSLQFHRQSLERPPTAAGPMMVHGSVRTIVRTRPGTMVLILPQYSTTWHQQPSISYPAYDVKV